MKNPKIQNDKKLVKLFSKVRVNYNTRMQENETGLLSVLIINFPKIAESGELLFARHFYDEEAAERAKKDMNFVAEEVFWNGLMDICKERDELEKKVKKLTKKVDIAHLKTKGGEKND